MYDTNVTIVGNALNAPELRRTSSTNALVASFRVASTSRRYDRDTGRWVDGSSLRVRVTCWRRLAEGVTRSVVTGDPLMVTGRMYTRDWVGDDGQHRVSYELEAVAVGHDLSRGFSQFVRHRPAGATSVVENVETDTRIGGEATIPVPVPASAAAYGAVPVPGLSRVARESSVGPERARPDEDADGYPTLDAIATAAFEPPPIDDDGLGGADDLAGVEDSGGAQEIGGVSVLGGAYGASRGAAGGGDPDLGGDDDAEDSDAGDHEAGDAVEAVRAAGLTDEVSSLGRRGVRRGRTTRIPVPAPV
jgi:single-strand DNA-binding protein